MITLSDLQVDLIRGDLRQNGIEMESLENDLLDHICCSMEYEMGEGIDFETAYTLVKEQVCPQGVREIQEETTYLLSLKFKKMKNTINITGCVGAILMLLGSIFRIQHWMGANVMLLLGALMLIVTYLPYLYYRAMTQTDRGLTKVRHTVGFGSAVVLVLGILFKIMHWPGATVLFYLGIGAAVLLFVPLFLKTATGESSIKLEPTTMVIPVIAAISLLMAFSTVSNSKMYKASIMEMDYELVNYTNAMDRSNETLLLSSKIDKKDKLAELGARSTALTSFIDQLKQRTIEQLGYEGTYEEVYNDPGFALQYDARHTNALFLDQGTEELIKANFARELGEEVDAFLQFANQEFKFELAEQFALLDTKSMTKAGSVNWERDCFQDKPLCSIFNVLTRMKLQALQIENQLIITNSSTS